MDVKKSRKKGKGTTLSPLHIGAFEGRVVVKDTIFDAVVSEIKGPGGETTLSSLPHLTHKKDARAAHITSSRVVAVSGAYVIHQRFHQNDDGASEPTHDRYFAVHSATGVVHAATVKFKTDVHLGKKDELPMRGQTLAKTDGLHELKLEFTVGDPDVKVPPLSPRSTHRKLPPTGYQ